MLSKQTMAIDSALKLMNAKKFSYFAEDDNAYYISACGDNGERIHGEMTCRVDKSTMICERCFRTDKNYFTPRKRIPIPKDRDNIFVRFEDYE